VLSDSKLDFVVRKARHDDIPAVIRVNMESLPEHYWYGFFEYILDNWGEAFLVAEVNGIVIGYSMSRVEDVRDPVLAGLGIEYGDGFFRRIINMFKTSPWGWRVGHLVSIAVLEPYRGRGIGKALLRRTIDVMDKVYGVEAIYLEVRVSNLRAIGLYEKFGFKRVKTIKSYYRDGEDAYVMVKRLKPLPSNS